MCYDGGHGYTIRRDPGGRLSIRADAGFLIHTERHEPVQVELAPGQRIYTDSAYFIDLIRRKFVEQHETMIAAEKLLRIALFSDELPMTTEASLPDRRKKLAGTIRAFRKKGVIPVFVSTLWYLLAVAISIESAFGDRGTTQGAHNLALGLLLAFLPIFILS